MTTRVLICFALAGFLAAGGCAGWRSAPELPVRNSMVLDQLVIFSDSPLPKNHRLLQELRTLRTVVSTKLGLPISDEPIHVYLFPKADRFEAFMHEHHPNLPLRRAFFVETDTRLSVYAYWGDRVAEDLRHEVVHGYLHSVVPHLPLWLDEGLAEYFEVPRGLSGMNRPHVDQSSGQAAGHGRPDLKRLEQLRSTAEMSQAEYAESWAWVHYLLETTPQNQQLLRDYLQTLIKSTPHAPLSDELRRADPRYLAHLAEHLAVVRQSLQ
ncbi:MAG: DUF1570 domain-containing protein [Pirellulales bacterium]